MAYLTNRLWSQPEFAADANHDLQAFGLVCDQLLLRVLNLQSSQLRDLAGSLLDTPVHHQVDDQAISLQIDHQLFPTPLHQLNQANSHLILQAQSQVVRFQNIRQRFHRIRNQLDQALNLIQSQAINHIRIRLLHQVFHLHNLLFRECNRQDIHQEVKVLQ